MSTFICALGKIFYTIYITGNVELPNINGTDMLRVSFTQTNSFVSGETRAQFHMKVTCRQRARPVIVSRHSSLTQYGGFQVVSV